MKAEDAAFNDGGQRQVIEQACEILPNIGISVLSQAFIIKSIDLGDLLTLVITSQDGNSVWVSNFESDEKSHGLNRVVTSIDVISHEKVVVIRQSTTNFE
tara:strand:+ start:646 stop:945 length:300 start_codon:yes stop_codon:yes gene_type:complete